MLLALINILIIIVIGAILFWVIEKYVRDGRLQVVQCEPRELGLGARGFGLGSAPGLPRRFGLSSWHLPSFLLFQA